jgi:putative flippase GtrA
MMGLLTREAHTWYLIASILASQIAILINFALTEWLAFRGARTDKPLLFRFASYLLISNASLLIGGPWLLLLVSALGMDLLLANVLSLALLFLARFAIADSYIWSGESLCPTRLAFSEAKA